MLRGREDKKKKTLGLLILGTPELPFVKIWSRAMLAPGRVSSRASRLSAPQHLSVPGKPVTSGDEEVRHHHQSVHRHGRGHVHPGRLLQLQVGAFEHQERDSVQSLHVGGGKGSSQPEVPRATRKQAKPAYRQRVRGGGTCRSAKLGDSLHTQRIKDETIKTTGKF